MLRMGVRARAARESPAGAQSIFSELQASPTGSFNTAPSACLQVLPAFALTALALASQAADSCECIALTVFALKSLILLLTGTIISLCTIDRDILIPRCLNEEIYLFGNPVFGGRLRHTLRRMQEVNDMVTKV